MDDAATRRRIMVDTQVRPSDVTQYPIIDAMLEVRREAFLPDPLREAAYVGQNLPLAPGRVLLEPRTFAKMLEALSLSSKDVVLHLGAGCGYGTAVMARLASFVVAIEEDAQLAQGCEQALIDQGVDNAAVLTGVLAAGMPQTAPFDAIVLEGAVEDVPQVLLEQIKDGGRIVALFAQDGLGQVRLGRCIEGRIHWRFLFNALAPVLPGFEKKKEFAL